MANKLQTPCRLAISFAIDKYSQAVFGAQEFADRELYARRDLGIKFLEQLEVDQPMTVRLRRHSEQDFRRQAIVTTLDLEVMAVETMRVVRREIVMKEIEEGWKCETIPEPPVKSNPGVLGRAWNGWKKYVDQCRESLGG